MSRTILALVFTASLAVAAPLGAGNLFVTLPALDFEGGTHNAVGFGGDFSRFCANSYCEMASSAKLPHGATFLGLEIDGCIDTVGDKPLRVYFLRQQGNGDGLVTVASGTFSDVGCKYRFVQAATPHAINDWGNEYFVLVTTSTTDCIITPSSCGDAGTRFQSVRLYYRPNGGGTVEPSKASASVVFPE